MSRRLALFFDGFDQGGIGRVNLILAEEFLRRGFAVDLLVYSSDGPRRGEAPAGAVVHDLQRAAKFKLLARLYKYFRNQDVVAVYASNALSAVYVSLAARLARASVAVVGIHHVDIAKSLQGQAFWSAKYLQTRYLLRFFQRTFGFSVAAVSAGARTSLIRCTGLAESAVQVLHNPVKFSETADLIPQGLLDWWGESGAAKILTVGRITPEKDIAGLVDAISLVSATRTARLIVVGFGPYRQDLERYIACIGMTGQVRFAGFVANPRNYYENADLFVSNSWTEALPLTLIEALSVGVPVISTDCPYGPSEILGDGRWGRLVPMRDPVGLADAVLGVLREERHPERLRARAADFSADRAATQYLSYALVNPEQLSISKA